MKYQLEELRPDADNPCFSEFITTDMDIAIDDIILDLSFDDLV